ncbi:MAG: PadR family transcriptional regulator [Anaerolineae bacterium]|nr:PadR family transcriptional regulator [Anaerolineae bacterium]
MSLQQAILGFLALRPLTGYDLKKAFDGSVQHFWPADQAQIYRTLNKLDELGLASVELVEQEDKPDRKVYHITENGRSALHTWLSDTLPPTSEREPLLVRIFFSGFVDDETLLPRLAEAMAQEKAYLAAMQAILANAQQQVETLTEPAERRIGFFQLLTVERAILHHQAQIAWLESIITRLENQDLSIETP